MRRYNLVELTWMNPVSWTSAMWWTLMTLVLASAVLCLMAKNRQTNAKLEQRSLEDDQEDDERQRPR